MSCASQKSQMKYALQYQMGKAASDDARCPYPIEQIGKRCAWLAGFNDARSSWLWQKLQQCGSRSNASATS